MSGECDKCGEHALECVCLNASEQQLLKITSNLTWDYLSFIKKEQIDSITIADIRWFCLSWIKKHIKDE